MTPLAITTSSDWSLPAWEVIAVAAVAVVLLLLALVFGVVESRSRGRVRREVAELRERLSALEAALRQAQGPATAAAVPEPVEGPAPAFEYHITSIGQAEPELAPAETRVTVAPPPVADALLREGVVQTASFLHGVRRALAPETRNRIAFEMRREVKRSRKDRKAEVKEALREYRARHRAEVADLEADMEVAR